MQNPTLYLFTIKNENKRKSLARLRISAHTLEIERGRYTKLKREEQLCKACLKIEDKPHFLLDCNLFKINNDKIRLFMEKEVVPNFNFMDNKQQFVFLMIKEDINIISCISDIIFENFQMLEKMV